MYSTRLPRVPQASHLEVAYFDRRAALKHDSGVAGEADAAGVTRGIRVLVRLGRRRVHHGHGPDFLYGST